MSTTRKYVLIVDDEPDTCTYFSAILEDQGFETDLAYSGVGALLKLQERIPDLITLDVSMPEKSGVGFYREIKSSELWRHVPVIIITGVSDDFRTFISSRGQVPPPEGYLSKPVNPEEFLEIVRSLTS